MEPKQVVANIRGNAFAASLNINASMTLDTPDCNVMVAGDLIIDSKQGVPLPISCDRGEEAGSWTPGNEGGMWAVPLALGAWAWSVCRIFIGQNGIKKLA